jgi:hypothetical protein
MKAIISRRELTVISGGQTGADQAGLDWALANGVRVGGWCPKGRKTEAGRLNEIYPLRETPSSTWLQRTEWNVRDSEATLIFTMAAALTGGSRRTADFARAHCRPFLHMWPGRSEADLIDFLACHPVGVLNVSGSRRSRFPDVRTFVQRSLDHAMSLHDGAVALGTLTDEACGSSDSRALLNSCIDLMKEAFLLTIPLVTKRLDNVTMREERIGIHEARILRRWLLDRQRGAPGPESAPLEASRRLLRGLRDVARVTVDEWREQQYYQVPRQKQPEADGIVTWSYTWEREQANWEHELTEHATAAALTTLPFDQLCECAMRLDAFPEQDARGSFHAALSVIARQWMPRLDEARSIRRHLLEDATGQILIDTIDAVVNAAHQPNVWN